MIRMSTFQRTPYGYRGLYRPSRGYIEGVMPASTYTRLTGKLTTQPYLPEYVGRGIPSIPMDIHPGLRVPVTRPYGPIVRAPTFIPRWKTRYALG